MPCSSAIPKSLCDPRRHEQWGPEGPPKKKKKKNSGVDGRCYAKDAKVYATGVRMWPAGAAVGGVDAEEANLSAATGFFCSAHLDMQTAAGTKRQPAI